MCTARALPPDVCRTLHCAERVTKKRLPTTRPTAAVTGIRLVGGPNANSGRLEVQVGGVWGAVCAAGFDEAVAAVACRQLGKTGGIPHGFTYFGPAPDNYPHIIFFAMMGNFQRCSGFERSLTECRWDIALFACDGPRDAGVAGLECSP